MSKISALAELDTAIKEFNLALQWHAKSLHIKSNSLCAYHWLSDTLKGNSRICNQSSKQYAGAKKVEYNLGTGPRI